jgi:dUTPase
MIDQGNLIRSGVAISEQFAKKLGLPYHKLTPAKVGTAATGGHLTKLGITKVFTVRFNNFPHALQTKATVLRGLSDDINLGGGFLQRLAGRGLAPKLIFHDNGTSLELGGQHLELIKQVQAEPEDGEPGEPDKVPASSARVHVPLMAKKEAKLPAHSLSFVNVQQLPGDWAVDTAGDLGAPGRGALRAVYHQLDRVAVINPGPACTVPQGQLVGTAVLLTRARMKEGMEKVKQLADCEQPLPLDELYSALGVDDNDILKGDPNALGKVKQLVQEYQDIFASPQHQFGCTDLIEFDVEIKEGSRPVKQRVRPLNPAQQADLRRQLDDWIGQGVVESMAPPCEWAAALVPVLKKDGSWRWCCDYRGVNQATVGFSYPLPIISDNIDKLQGSKIYSTLDAAAAYNCIKVKERAKPFLAFTSPFGLFTWKRMPFGAKNSGGYYSKMMEMLVEKLRSPWVMNYLDDVVIHTVDLEQHLEQLEKVFALHREAGIKLKASKTFLCQTHCEYLGFIVQPEGCSMKTQFVEKILDWPLPVSGKQLASFLGFTSYYRTFIEGFSQLTAEMNAHKKDLEVEWTVEMKTNFHKLKECFRDAPIRAYPYFGQDAKPFQLRTDFSGRSLGAVLEQEQGGVRRFIAAAGRKTTNHESNYPSTKGELCAVVYGLRKWEHILRWRVFEIYSDNSALQWLATMKNPKGIYWRWLAELSSYNYSLGWQKGTSMGAPDGLSRADHMDEPTVEETQESQEYIGRIDDDEGINAIRLDMATIRQCQEDDAVLKEVVSWVRGASPTAEELKGKSPDLRTYHKNLGALYLDDGGVLLHRYLGGQPLADQQDRICVPDSEDLREEVYRWSHCHPSAGHFGGRASALRASKKFFWPGLVAWIKRRVQECEACLAKIQTVNLKDTVHQPRRQSAPSEVLYVDLVGPLPVTAQGVKYALTMQDGFSRYVQAVAIPCKTAEVVAGYLLNEWLCRFGMVGRIHSDQGGEFKNRVWQNLCDRLDIEKTFTPAYNPNSDQIEAFHKSLNQILRCFMERDEKSWDKYLPAACFAYNTKVHETTAITPFEAFFGRAARLPIDLVIPTPDRVYPSQSAFVDETLRRFELIYAHLQKNSQARFRRNARGYSGKENKYEEGDLVWVFTKRKVPGKPTKITDQWVGPYSVVSVPAEVLLTVRPANTTGEPQVVHVSRVRRYFGARDCTKYRPHAEPMGDDDGDDVGEEVGGGPRILLPKQFLSLPVDAAMEPPEMTDLPARSQAKVSGKANEVVVAQTPAHQPSSRGEEMDEAIAPPVDSKRDREETNEGANEDKKLRRQAEKRPAPPRRRSTRSKARWRALVETSDSDQLPGMDKIEDDDEIHQIGQDLVVSIPPGSVPPARANEATAAWDFRANQSVTLAPGKCTQVDLGVRLTFDSTHLLFLKTRGHHALSGITVQAGVIDSDYRGPLKVLLFNHSNNRKRVTKGEKICQGVFISSPKVQWQEAELPQDDTCRDMPLEPAVGADAG